MCRALMLSGRRTRPSAERDESIASVALMRIVSELSKNDDWTRSPHGDRGQVGLTEVLPAASTGPVLPVRVVEAGEIGFDFAPETQFGAGWGTWGVL